MESIVKRVTTVVEQVSTLHYTIILLYYYLVYYDRKGRAQNLVLIIQLSRKSNYNGLRTKCGIIYAVEYNRLQV